MIVISRSPQARQTIALTASREISGGCVKRALNPSFMHKGMKDDEIIPLLHQFARLTFFTLDGDFYDARLCHEGYCLVHMMWRKRW